MPTSENPRITALNRSARAKPNTAINMASAPINIVISDKFIYHKMPIPQLTDKLKESHHKIDSFLRLIQTLSRFKVRV